MSDARAMSRTSGAFSAGEVGTTKDRTVKDETLKDETVKSHTAKKHTVRPESIDEGRLWLEANFREAQATIVPSGARLSGQSLYRSPQALVTFDTTGWNRLIDYPARDMTITVEAGMTWRELCALLDVEGQQLPLDVLEGEATIGGLVASGFYGPRQYGYGTIRDYLLGFSGLTADGLLFQAGGRVVKNVAGYDLAKLMCGSRGTLALLTQCTFKLKPQPAQWSWVLTTWETWEDLEPALERLLLSETRPVAVDVLQRAGLPPVGNDLTLAILLEGSQVSLDWEVQTIRKELSNLGPTELLVISEDRKTAPADRLMTCLLSSQQQRPYELMVSLPSSKLVALARQFPETTRIMGRGLDGTLVLSWNEPPAHHELAAGLASLIDSASLAGHPQEAIWEWTRWPDDSIPPPANRPPEASSSRWSWALKQQLDPLGLLNPSVLDLRCGRPWPE